MAFWERSPASILKVIQGVTYDQAWEHHYLPERPHMLGSRLLCLWWIQCIAEIKKKKKTENEWDVNCCSDSAPQDLTQQG